MIKTFISAGIYIIFLLLYSIIDKAEINEREELVQMVITDDCRFYLDNTNKLFLQVRGKMLKSIIVEHVVNDIAQYGAILFADLGIDGVINVYDRNFKRIYSIDLSVLDVLSPQYITFVSQSKIAIYDGFSSSVYIVDLNLETIINQFSVPINQSVIDIAYYKHEIYILLQSQLLKVDQTGDETPILSNLNPQNLYVAENNVYLLNDSSQVIDVQQAEILIDLDTKSISLCGIVGEYLIFLDKDRRLDSVKCLK